MIAVAVEILQDSGDSPRIGREQGIDLREGAGGPVLRCLTQSFVGFLPCRLFHFQCLQSGRTLPQGNPGA